MDPVEPQIGSLLQQFPDLPSTVIMERIGWARGKTVLFGRIARLRPLYRPVDPVSRTQYEPGGLAQCDLRFPPVDVPLGFGQLGRPPVLVMVMVAGYSRVITGVMIPTRQAADLLAGHWQLLSGWGRVPRVLVWDNESAVGQYRVGLRALMPWQQACCVLIGSDRLVAGVRDRSAVRVLPRLRLLVFDAALLVPQGFVSSDRTVPALFIGLWVDCTQATAGVPGRLASSHATFHVKPREPG